MPEETELEGENGCGGKQNDRSTGTVPTDQDDPTSISRRSLQAAVTALLVSLGILLLMETTWIPLANYSWDLRLFTGLSKTPFQSPNKTNKNKYRAWLEKSKEGFFFTEVLHNVLPIMQKIYSLHPEEGVKAMLQTLCWCFMECLTGRSKI